MRERTTSRLAVGDRLDGYAITRVLGEGGFAKVYQVAGPYGEPAVIKLAKSASPNPYGGGTVAMRFAQPIAFHTGGIGPLGISPSQVIEREGMMLKGLSDPFFPQVHATGTLGERAYILYEYVEGATLRERFEEREAPPLMTFLEIGEALAARSASGRLPFHGDLKPENIIIEPSGRWRLLDPSCASAEGKPLGTRGLITTPSYYPFLTPDDRPALALMIVEALTGIALISEDPVYPPQRATHAFHQWLDALTVAGRGRYVQALRHVPRLEELSLIFSEELSRVVLKALYLRREPDGLLDVEEGYLGWRDFMDDLAYAVGASA